MTTEPEGAIPSPTSAGNADASNRSSGLAPQAEPESPEIHMAQVPWYAVKSTRLGDWRWSIMTCDDRYTVVVGVMTGDLARRIAELHNEDLEKL